MSTKTTKFELHNIIHVFADRHNDELSFSVQSENSTGRNRIYAYTNANESKSLKNAARLNDVQARAYKSFRNDKLVKFAASQGLDRSDYTVAVIERPEDRNDVMFVAIRIASKQMIEEYLDMHSRGKRGFYMDGICSRVNPKTGRYSTMHVNAQRITDCHTGFRFTFTNSKQSCENFAAKKKKTTENYISNETLRENNESLRTANYAMETKIAELEKQIAELKAANEQQAKKLVELDPDFETDSVPVIETSELTMLDSYKYIEENSLKSLLMLDATFNKGIPETRILATVV
ncbi:hypothetical protein [Vibrio fluvialis]|uniref:hypothetical protein n=1 Tax=Vibrio fluvialis TaxID=676 RepID=UPI001C9D0FA5|nr:hypothetical protein [Vibrio fluvialis]MBY8157087.1 hypothetical protein [Vibrio fluvialis]MDT8865844.1 hypothetical protein [Vibrio fluvialis]MDT8873612.1 hypothetical protein [Vibrio fluvialis]